MTGFSSGQDSSFSQTLRKTDDLKSNIFLVRNSNVSLYRMAGYQISTIVNSDKRFEKAVALHS